MSSAEFDYENRPVADFSDEQLLEASWELKLAEDYGYEVDVIPVNHAEHPSVKERDKHELITEIAAFGIVGAALAGRQYLKWRKKNR